MSRERRSKESFPAYFSGQVEYARRFHLRRSRQAGESVEVVSGGLEHCRPDYAIERAGFPHPILEFVAGGAGELWLDGAAHDLTPGAVFVYGRGFRHTMRCDPARPMRKYFLALAGDGVQRLLKRNGLRPGGVIRVAEPDRIRQVFDDLIGLALGDRADREAACVHTLHYLLAKIADLATAIAPSEARAFATYQRCRAYLEGNYRAPGNIRAAARACHVDEAYLCRLFRRFGRESPFHFLQHLRMNHAASQLQGSDRLIKDLALELGFTDAANFTRAFRRWFGVPPGDLRRPLRKAT